MASRFTLLALQLRTLVVLWASPGASAYWIVYPGFDSNNGHSLPIELPEGTSMPDDCKFVCEQDLSCHGFVVWGDVCYFRGEEPADLERKRHTHRGSTLYVMATTPAFDWAMIVIGLTILGMVIVAIVVCWICRGWQRRARADSVVPGGYSYRRSPSRLSPRSSPRDLL